jgi:hypothetical protein
VASGATRNLQFGVAPGFPSLSWCRARAEANVSFDQSGALAGAEAFAGAGSMLVEEVRLVKGAEIIIE